MTPTNLSEEAEYFDSFESPNSNDDKDDVEFDKKRKHRFAKKSKGKEEIVDENHLDQIDSNDDELLEKFLNGDN